MGTATHTKEKFGPARAEALGQVPTSFYVFRVGADGSASFPFVSQACADLYGVSARAVMDEARLMHNAIHPHDRDRFDADGQRSLRTLQTLRWEGRIVRPDGSERHVVVTSQPRRIANGATEWLGAVVEQSPAAGHAAALNVGGGGDAVPDRWADAVAMLGHDLAGPVTGIRLFAELALEEVNRESSEPPSRASTAAVRRCLEAVVRQSHRLDDLRTDFLTAAEAELIQAHPVTVDVLAELLTTVADLPASPVSVTIDCGRDLRCSVQRSHLSRMLSNLTSNAVRHAESEVVLTASQHGDRVLITVRDDGPGVPSQVVPRLFTRFSHAGASLKPSGAGTGLGLYIVRSLADANSGTVSYSPSDFGASFTLALPAA